MTGPLKLAKALVSCLGTFSADNAWGVSGGESGAGQGRRPGQTRGSQVATCLGGEGSLCLHPAENKSP